MTNDPEHMFIVYSYIFCEMPVQISSPFPPVVCFDYSAGKTPHTFWTSVLLGMSLAVISSQSWGEVLIVYHHQTNHSQTQQLKQHTFIITPSFCGLCIKCSSTGEGVGSCGLGGLSGVCSWFFLIDLLFSSATSAMLFGPYSPLQFLQQEVSPAPGNYQNNTGTLEDGPQAWTQGPQPLDPWQSSRGGGGGQ